MSDDRVTETITAAQPTHTTTIVERRGVGGGLFIGLAVLVLVVVGAFYLMSQNSAETKKDAAITEAAKDVGAAARDVGESAKKAVE
ncbi:hypothetical protein [Sphingomonas sp.]|uniref:hypothetical protein n=1 Tax=Sphingomonas sp. TaxID=28214 RepID=UPI002DD6BA1E|nr:hypothetical protein [Sphingomonas sp.]